MQWWKLTRLQIYNLTTKERKIGKEIRVYKTLPVKKERKSNGELKIAEATPSWEVLFPKAKEELMRWEWM